MTAVHTLSCPVQIQTLPVVGNIPGRSNYTYVNTTWNWVLKNYQCVCACAHVCTFNQCNCKQFHQKVPFTVHSYAMYITSPTKRGKLQAIQNRKTSIIHQTLTRSQCKNDKSKLKHFICFLHFQPKFIWINSGCFEVLLLNYDKRKLHGPTPHWPKHSNTRCNITSAIFADTSGVYTKTLSCKNGSISLWCIFGK